jgi:hypothetical protein
LVRANHPRFQISLIEIQSNLLARSSIAEFKGIGFSLSRRDGSSVSKDINVVALVKGEERYIFLFNDQQKSQTLRTLGKYASDPALSFSWYDAAVLSQKVRNAARAESASDVLDSRSGISEDLFSSDDS